MTAPDIRLLGPVEVLVDGRSIALPGPRVQTLLVLLALSGGRVVTFERLAAGVWEDDPPLHVRGALQTYVGRLRRIVGEDVIETDTAGYRLRTPPARVDALEFRRLVGEAEASQDEARRRGLLREALALWPEGPTGEALTDWLRHHESPALTELYLWAFEQRVDLDLTAARQQIQISEVRALSDRFPLRESLWARLLRTLHASGRRAEALDRYETLRTRLATELGVDPSKPLQEIHHRLLQDACPLERGAPTIRE